MYLPINKKEDIRFHPDTKDSANENYAVNQSAKTTKENGKTE